MLFVLPRKFVKEYQMYNKCSNNYVTHHISFKTFGGSKAITTSDRIIVMHMIFGTGGYLIHMSRLVSFGGFN